MPKNQEELVKKYKDAIKNENLSEFAYVIELGLDFSTMINEQHNVLAYTIATASQEMILLLLESSESLGLDLSWKDPLGWTYMQQAAIFGKYEVLKFFLENQDKHNLTVNDVHPYGRTPLDFASNEKCQGLLRSYGGKTADELRQEREKRG